MTQQNPSLKDCEFRYAPIARPAPFLVTLADTSPIMWRIYQTRILEKGYLYLGSLFFYLTKNTDQVLRISWTLTKLLNITLLGVMKG